LPGNVRELKKLIERAVILTPLSKYIDTSVCLKEMFHKSRPVERWPVVCGDAANT